MLWILAALVPTVATVRPRQRFTREGGRRRPAISTPTLSGVEIRAAGVIPYTMQEGQGLKFFMQDMTNGSRVGQLCDFGGRSEHDDADLFFTAARELEEETSAAFGSADDVAAR